ncbi:MAG: SpoIIE family protein phosphatase, partial [Campylobacterales bacterium]|nr:SpoIIE family protein phosphatase [Campylobacterales bacterium]
MNLSQEKANKVLEIISRYSKKISSQNIFAEVIHYTALMAKELVEADRCTIWIYDEVREDLWSKVSHGIDEEIRIDSHKGIVGDSLQIKQPIIVNDPYNDPRFNNEIDKELGYKTKCILTYPIIGEDGKIVGVFQTVNKNESAEKDHFVEEDIEILSIASSFGSKILIGEHYEKINDYNRSAQSIAFKKQRTAVVNQLENSLYLDTQIIYKPADVLSGDIYSIYKTEEGNILVFIVDAMGHGIMPALTSYAIASLVKQYIKTANYLQDIASEILKSLEPLMADGEQVSCFFMWFDKDFKTLDYFGGGMYPQMVKQGKKITKLKSNNPPLMSFTRKIKIDALELKDFSGLFMYSDGIIEDEEFGVEKDHLEKM